MYLNRVGSAIQADFAAVAVEVSELAALAEKILYHQIGNKFSVTIGYTEMDGHLFIDLKDNPDIKLDELKSAGYTLNDLSDMGRIMNFIFDTPVYHFRYDYDTEKAIVYLPYGDYIKKSLNIE